MCIRDSGFTGGNLNIQAIENFGVQLAFGVGFAKLLGTNHSIVLWLIHNAVPPPVRCVRRATPDTR